jgi:nitrogen regulatory protein PII
MIQINYIVKVKNAKLGELKKALTQAGIEVMSIVEVYKEEIPVPAEERPEG